VGIERSMLRSLSGHGRSPLLLALGFCLVAQAAGAQAPAETLPASSDSPRAETPPATSTAESSPSAAPAKKAANTERPLAARPATTPSAPEPQPRAAAPDTGLAVRIEALDELAKGTLPDVALDSVLSVSLDDDSSMIERDGEVRAEQRRLTVALNQAERTQTKSEAELQQMRDQILALELERKVLSLPIEVRERLVRESYEASEPKEAPPDTKKEEAPKPVATAQPRSLDDAGTKSAPARAKTSTPHEPTWLWGWPLFVALLLVTFVATRGVAAFVAKRPLGLVDARRAQAGMWIQLGIGCVGTMAAILVCFRLPPAIAAVTFAGTLLFAVLAGKDVAASLVGGLVLFFQGPFRVGHRIEIEGVEGRVVKMGLLFVRVASSQLRVIDIPNRDFLSKNVAASPASAILPLQVDFYLEPRADIAAAKNIILDVVQSTTGVDASHDGNGIFVSQVPLNGTAMVRLRAKVYLMSARPEQELASEISERVIERLHGRGAPTKIEVESQDPDRARSITRSTAH